MSCSLGCDGLGVGTRGESGTRRRRGAAPLALHVPCARKLHPPAETAPHLLKAPDFVLSSSDLVALCHHLDDVTHTHTHKTLSAM